METDRVKGKTKIKKGASIDKNLMGRTLSIVYGDYTVRSYYRAIESNPSNGGTNLVIYENSTGTLLLFRDSNNDDILDEVRINFEQSTEEILVGKEADEEFGAIFRAIQVHILDNILVYTLPTNDDKHTGTHLFIPQRSVYLC